jgi:hypothetical protein
MDYMSYILPVISVMFGAGGIFTALSERKKRKAESTLVESQAALNYSALADSWIQRLDDKVKALECKVRDLEQTLDIYEAEIHTLTVQLRQEREKNGISSDGSRSTDNPTPGYSSSNSSHSYKD